MAGNEQVGLAALERAVTVVQDGTVVLLSCLLAVAVFAAVLVALGAVARVGGSLNAVTGLPGRGCNSGALQNGPAHSVRR